MNKNSLKILKLNFDRYYKWKRDYEVKGMEGLKNHKSAPESCLYSLLEKKISYHHLRFRIFDVLHKKLVYNIQDYDIAYIPPSSSFPGFPLNSC